MVGCHHGVPVASSDPNVGTITTATLPSITRLTAGR